MKKMIFLLPFLFLLVLSCDQLTPAENHDPYPLVSPESIIISSGDATQTVRLMCSENPDGAYLYDEDGDTVSVVVDPDTPLPDSISLNEQTGVLTVIRTSDVNGTLRFWTVDNNGGTTEDQPLTVNYTISSAGNTAPTASFATWDYEVSGADEGLSNVNGNYSITGTLSWGKSNYANDNGFELFFCRDSSATNLWGIDDNTVIDASTDSEKIDLTYYVENSDDYPPTDIIWILSSTDNPSTLQIKSVPFDGDTADWGNTLTASYIFSDPDGHSEGSSTYKWYRNSIALPNTYTEIGGADEISYTTVEADDGLRLKFEVTPVDEFGLSGTPVLSEASREIGST